MLLALLLFQLLHTSNAIRSRALFTMQPKTRRSLALRRGRGEAQLAPPARGLAQRALASSSSSSSSSSSRKGRLEGHSSRQQHRALPSHGSSSRSRPTLSR